MSSPFLNNITLPTKGIEDFSSPKEALDYMRLAGGRVKVEKIDLTEELLAQLQGIGNITNNVYKNGVYISMETKTAILQTLGLADDKIWEEWMIKQEEKLASIKKYMGNPEDITDAKIKEDYQNTLDQFYENIIHVWNTRDMIYIHALEARYQALSDDIYLLDQRLESEPKVGYTQRKNYLDGMNNKTDNNIKILNREGNQSKSLFIEELKATHKELGFFIDNQKAFSHLDQQHYEKLQQTAQDIRKKIEQATATEVVVNHGENIAYDPCTKMTMDEIKQQLEKWTDELDGIKKKYIDKHTLAMEEEDISKCNQLMVQAVRGTLSRSPDSYPKLGVEEYTQMCTLRGKFIFEVAGFMGKFTNSGVGIVHGLFD